MGTLSKKIAIAAQDLTEWVIISFVLNLIFAYMIAVTADLKYFRGLSWVMYLTMTSFVTEHMGVSRFALVKFSMF